MQVPDTYLITYTYTDSSGNPAIPVIRTIKVEDKTPPVITLIGDTNVTHPYPPLHRSRAKWNDTVDGNGTADTNGSVDSNTPGIYQITYSATDTAGNAAEPVVRTIQVVDNQDNGNGYGYGDSGLPSIQRTRAGAVTTGVGDSNGFILDTSHTGSWRYWLW